MNDLFLRAARGERVEKIPVWFMRQAGRSLPGYRELRKKYDILTLTQTPELAAEISLEPVERLGVDAAILFADIMLLPIALGIPVRIVENIGPMVDEPITNLDDLKRLRLFERGEISFLERTIGILRSELKIPLIGFSGAPFTLASYLIEGQPSRTWTKTKRCMYESPELWAKLMELLSDGVIGYLETQIDAGAQAVQLFDSWVGCLPPSDYRAHVLPYVQKIFSAFAEKNVPRIHFGTNTAGFLADFANVDGEVIGVDWRVELGAAKKVIGNKTLQGNLEPAAMLADWSVIQTKVDGMLQEIDPHEKYIFNLGHGVLPETNDAMLKKLVEYVHEK
jgi:uroporphyrinogen decarboxylase